MPYYFDRVQETTTSSGVGTVTLAGAVSGFQSFSTVFNGASNRVFYCIVDGTAWEVGCGTYTLIGTTLSRDTVYASSSGGSKISLSGGTSKVFMDLPASAIQDKGTSVASWMCGVMQ